MEVSTVLAKRKLKIKDSIFFMAPLSLMCALWYQPASAQEVGGCQLPNSGRLSGAIELQSNCTYPQGITVSDSNTHIDCKGATLDGKHSEKIGILISSEGRSLRNVSVKNCTVKNFSQTGVLVTSEIPNYKRSNDHEKNYNETPTNVTLDSLNVLSNDGAGVYFHSYVSNSTLKNSRIEKSKAEGIYLDQSSRGNHILNNTIKNNGELDGPNSGQRVGLAIDSSAKNLVENNKFIGNFGGGVFLYKNCGENFSKGMSVIRWQHSDENTIKNNVFDGEKVGVWIASRQSSNLQRKDCGDKPLDADGKYYQDFANNNTITGNKFCRNKTYIRVEGDNNTITNNRSDNNGRWVVEPTSMKTRLTGIPTTGNKITNNSFEKCEI
ncbi:right-handed parallel beta-helix repeat-containing protein [Pseudomonas sp. YuFO20]|uniref:right-handed parallel beta-helix repeat-containing protein n=1 Tax=Pseudomonas sp. YuFO20 TaxID=3095362 RepID=UPI002B253862|nr:right-handed parallel beta-helix repeat-containing protein [Pseudomonas sp. YuFO20]MEB2514774.1 right-handed parallel beta-helix repeat-containing protein [Pseudomonas sp. YuFO20]